MKNWGRVIGFIFIALGVDQWCEFMKGWDWIYFIVGCFAIGIGALELYENQEDKEGE